MRTTLLVLAAILLLATPAVVGHAAAPPRDFETRILHDHNDDSAIILAGKHGFDAIALDVRDARLPDGSPALVLRLILNGGCNANAPAGCPELSHVVAFTAGGEARSVALRTADGGTTWTGDAARHVGPESLNDGTRFAVEAWVPLAALGVTTGDAVTDWFVEGYAGDETADNMPEGALPGAPDPLGAAFDAGEYVLGSPDGYVTLAADADVRASPGEEVRLPVRVTNPLGVEQEVSLAALGSPGARIELDGAPVGNVTLAANFTKTVDLVVTAPVRDAPVVVVATTPLGGHAGLAVQVHAAPMPDAGAGQVTTPDVPAGATWSHTFTRTGTFTYHNHHAPAQSATVEVVDGEGGEEHLVTLTADGFDPRKLTVARGDTVTWTNGAEGLLRVMGAYDSVGVPDQEHDGHDHGHGPEAAADAGNDAPGLPFVLVVAALAGLAARRSEHGP